jgi:hypothetical protein
MVNGNPANQNIHPYCPFRVRVDDNQVVLDYSNGETVKVTKEEFEELNLEGLLEEIRVTKPPLLGYKTPAEAFATFLRDAPHVKKNTIWRRHRSPTEWWCKGLLPCNHQDGSWDMRVILMPVVGNQKPRRLWLEELLSQYTLIDSPRRRPS